MSFKRSSAVAVICDSGGSPLLPGFSSVYSGLLQNAVGVLERDVMWFAIFKEHQDRLGFVVFGRKRKPKDDGRITCDLVHPNAATKFRGAIWAMVVGDLGAKDVGKPSPTLNGYTG